MAAIKQIFIPDISIICPVMQPNEFIAQNLEKLRKLPLKLELIVIDNYTNQKTRNTLREMRLPLQLKLILFAKQRSQTACLLSGAAHAKGKFLLPLEDYPLDTKNTDRLISFLTESTIQLEKYDSISNKDKNLLLIKTRLFKSCQYDPEMVNLLQDLRTKFASITHTLAINFQS